MPFFQTFLTRFGLHDCVEFPDALAAAYLLEPEIFTLEETPLFVETEGSCLGQSIPVPYGRWFEDQNDNTPIKPITILVQ